MFGEHIMSFYSLILHALYWIAIVIIESLIRFQKHSIWRSHFPKRGNFKIDGYLKSKGSFLVLM